MLGDVDVDVDVRVDQDLNVIDGSDDLLRRGGDSVLSAQDGLER